MNVFYPESAYTCNDNHIIALPNTESSSNSVYLVFYGRGWVLIASQMRIDWTLFTGLIYVPDTGCTLCNAGVALCTWIRGVGNEIPACVSPLMTSCSCWYSLLYSGFSFLLSYFLRRLPYVPRLRYLAWFWYVCLFVFTCTLHEWKEIDTRRMDPLF